MPKIVNTVPELPGKNFAMYFGPEIDDYCADQYLHDIVEWEYQW